MYNNRFVDAVITGVAVSLIVGGVVYLCKLCFIGGVSVAEKIKYQQIKRKAKKYGCYVDRTGRVFAYADGNLYMCDSAV